MKNMMKFENMKSAVVSTLPLSIAQVCQDDDHKTVCCWVGSKMNGGKNDPIVWQTEGAQVCNYAENVLRNTDYKRFLQYRQMLQTVVDEQTAGDVIAFAEIDANYAQRLEALCRVLFPEMVDGEADCVIKISDLAEK